MLLEFKARNYKSFKDELCLSMIPDADENALDYSVMKEEVAGKPYQALCSTVIYGPNASGKTNVISALDTFRRIVLRGHINNVDENPDAHNTASSKLELIPNNTTETPQPVEFSIRFLTNGMLIQYEFSTDLGGFLQENYDRKILSESLFVNAVPIFTRKNGVEASAESLKKFPQFFNADVLSHLDAIRKLPGWAVESRRLFLSNAFPSLLSPSLYKLILECLFENIITLCRSDALNVEDIFHAYAREKLLPQNRSSVILLPGMNDALARIGARNRLGYLHDPEENQTRLSSVFTNQDDNGGGVDVIPAESFESYGTYRFANLFLLLENAFFNGKTLVLDEFDASLHPMVLMNIINLFHDDEINRNHAQLIFNTHNPIFLDRSLFRRDEIKFVERDEETQSSELYALSDFEPERDCEDYLGNYFRNRYGAIQYVDLAPVFRKIMEENEKKSGED